VKNAKSLLKGYKICFIKKWILILKAETFPKKLQIKVMWKKNQSFGKPKYTVKPL